MNRQFVLLCSFVLSSHVCSSQILSTIAGIGVEGMSSDMVPALSAKFEQIEGVTVDQEGNIYVSDWANDVVFRIDHAGTMNRFAGTGLRGNDGDGGPAINASLDLDLSAGMTVDSIGNVYIGSGSNVRKVDASGIITTVAGNGVYASFGDGGQATNASFKAIEGICFDKYGNLYIVDGQDARIRKVNTLGIVSTYAGTGIMGFSGDGGPAWGAQIKGPDGIAVDNNGNVYFADGLNRRIRKVDPYGYISTIAGGPYGYSNLCYGCSATFLTLAGICGIAVDKYGYIYASDLVGDVVHKISPDGMAYAIAGTGYEGYSGNDRPATSSELYIPEGICLDNSGNLLIADKGNRRLRKIWFNATSVSNTNVSGNGVTVFPNPVVNKEFSCRVVAGQEEKATIEIYDILSNKLYSANIQTREVIDIPFNYHSGLYILKAFTSNCQFTYNFIVQ